MASQRIIESVVLAKKIDDWNVLLISLSSSLQALATIQYADAIGKLLNSFGASV
jgi:hypothetical protein